jgi:hypothetical protein
MNLNRQDAKAPKNQNNKFFFLGVLGVLAV